MNSPPPPPPPPPCRGKRMQSPPRYNNDTHHRGLMWCRPGRQNPDVLRAGIVGMRGSTVVKKLRPRMTLIMSVHPLPLPKGERVGAIIPAAVTKASQINVVCIRGARAREITPHFQKERKKEKKHHRRKTCFGSVRAIQSPPSEKRHKTSKIRLVYACQTHRHSQIVNHSHQRGNKKKNIKK